MSAGCVVVLLGPPGSGKGTQAARLSEDLGLPHVATGDLFRQNIAEGTELGKEAKGYMDAGELVPDDVVTGMLMDRIDQPDCRAGFVLDGYPRTLPQASAFEVGASGRWSIVVVLLRVDDATLVERAAGRLVCRDCDKVHHARFSPPRVSGRCDRCGGELYRRDDDAPGVVRERLRVYHHSTEPLVAYYRQRGLLEEVDGARTPDAVFADLKRLVVRAA